MTTMVQEVLSVWREVERTLEEYENREERDLRTEAEIRARIVELRSLFRSVTSSGEDTHRTIAASQTTIANARGLLATLHAGEIS